MAGKTYRNVGEHAVELVIGDTVPSVGVGDFIELSAEDEKANQTHIDEGFLLDVASIPPDVEPEAEAEAEAEPTEEKATKGGNK